MSNYKKILTAVVLIGIFTILFYSIISDFYFAGNEFCYPNDDAFIHLAISKNIAEHGVFGMTKYQFSSSSSSPVYTLILALAMKITSMGVTTPLLVNFTVSLILILFSIFYLRKKNFNYLEIVAVITILIIAAPLPALASLGMEHTLHVLISVLILFYFQNYIDEKSKHSFIILTVLVGLSILIRYENLSSLAAISLLIFVRGKRKEAFIFVAGSISFFILFGLYSILSGGYLLPNSVIVKGSKELNSYLMNPLQFLIGLKYPWVAGVFYLNLSALLLKQWVNSGKIDSLSIISFYVICLTMLHVIGADMGYIYRYEAYLMYLNVFCFALIIKKDIMPNFGVILRNISQFNNYNIFPNNMYLFGFMVTIVIMSANFLFVKPLADHIWNNYSNVKIGAESIHNQQYQTSKFVKKYYNNATIAANDIGAICYFSDMKLIDLVGLGSNEKISYKIARKPFDADAIYEWTNGKAEIAIIYDSWFVGRIPEQWVKVCDWSLPESYGLGDNIVSIYSVNILQTTSLISNLKLFEKELPSAVTVKYYK